MYNFKNDEYQSESPRPSFLVRYFPTLTFYLSLVLIVLRASKIAKKGAYKDDNWVENSHQVLKELEKIGVCVDISGIENLRKVEGPVIIIGNHMSMMETFLLPGVVQPIKPVTFVVKESLLNYPIFKYVMRARNPIALTRLNPRQDLKTIMREGLDRIQNSISIIVFPQTTRAHHFDPHQMSSIGVKLAAKAGVTVVPLALKTDCWENGKRFKDFGRININKKAYFSFGEPMVVSGKGTIEQEQINSFISSRLNGWTSIDDSVL